MALFFIYFYSLFLIILKIVEVCKIYKDNINSNILIINKMKLLSKIIILISYIVTDHPISEFLLFVLLF